MQQVEATRVNWVEPGADSKQDIQSIKPIPTLRIEWDVNDELVEQTVGAELQVSEGTSVSAYPVDKRRLKKGSRIYLPNFADVEIRLVLEREQAPAVVATVFHLGHHSAVQPDTKQGDLITLRGKADDLEKTSGQKEHLSTLLQQKVATLKGSSESTDGQQHSYAISLKDAANSSLTSPDHTQQRISKDTQEMRTSAPQSGVSLIEKGPVLRIPEEPK